MRVTYDLDGRQTVGEQGTVDSQSDADWAAMTVLQQGLTKYDAIGRPTHKALNADGAIQSVIQVSYDAANHQTCSAVRMNPSAFGSWPDFSSLPASACDLGTEGADGPDRISYATYDNADRLLKVTTGYGTSAPLDEGVLTYTANGQTATAADGKGNLTTYEYDGFDRSSKVRYPNASGGGSSTTDYEQYSYDVAGRVTQDRRRDGNTISFSYDNLGRATHKGGAVPDTDYGYDNLGRPILVSYSSGASADYAYQLTLAYDALGRNTSQSGVLGTMSYQYDLAGHRTRITWPDGFYVTYDYDAAGQMTAIKESGSFILGALSYDDLGRRTLLAAANGVHTTYGYDAASRLTSLGQDLAGATQDQTYGYAYNAAGQIKSRTSSNDIYQWTGGGTINRTYGSNGLNQLTTSGALTLGYDARGNLSSDGSTTFSYDAQNRLTSASTGATLGYDPAGRLSQISASAATRFLYSGNAIAAEYSASGALLRRYIPGPGVDEPIVWYEGAGTSDRRWLAADERGSVVAVTDASGAASAINTYDEYGAPGAGNVGRYQYTGQTFVSELGVYNYKARMYSPTLGRFMQTDPIGYGDGMNWYAYVGNDPINGRDPSGTVNVIDEIVVTAIRDWGWIDRFGDFFYRDILGRGGGVSTPSLDPSTEVSAVVVTAPKKKKSGKKATSPQNADACAAVSGGTTLQIGLAGQGTLGIFSYQMSAGLAFDSHGNVALYGAGGPGGGVGGGGAAGLTVQASNAPTVQDLGGVFANGSGGGGLGFGGTVDGFGGYARSGQPIVGGGFTAGAAGGETSFGGVTDTFVSPSLNLLGKPTC